MRYLDDIWGIWTDSRKEFEEFINVLNSHDPSIKLKYEIDQQSIHFLDTTLYKGPAFNHNQKLDIGHRKRTHMHYFSKQVFILNIPSKV